MRPVMMTSFGWPDGNCYAACVASIFEVELSDLPAGACPEMKPGEAIDAWIEPWQAWFAERNLRMMAVEAFEPEVNGIMKQHQPPGYCILSCAVLGVEPMSDGTELRHAVVTYNGKIVHDPHPNLKGNQGKLWPREFQLFFVLDPSLATGRAA